MKLLALEVENPGCSPDSFQAHLAEEARAVWDLYLSGVIREAHFRSDRHTAVLVLECIDEHHAREILSTLPLVRHNLIHFEIVPLSPYPGFARLFA